MRFWKVATIIALASIPLLIMKKKEAATPTQPVAADDSISWDVSAD